MQMIELILKKRLKIVQEHKEQKKTFAILKKLKKKQTNSKQSTD